MKKILTFLLLLFTVNSFAGVNYGVTINYWILPTKYGCDESQVFLTVGFSTYGEANNDYYEIRKSTDTDFDSGYTVVGGYIAGCGTCGDRNYQVIDYGTFVSGTTYYYQVRATDNFGFEGVPRYLGQYTCTTPTIVNWISQVSSSVEIGSTPNTESSYTWGVESKSGQGVTISLSPTEKANVYAELNNSKINFALGYGLMMSSIEVSVDNGGYFNLYIGSPVAGYEWNNFSSYFASLGIHKLEVNFTDPTAGIVYHREYIVNMVPQSNGFYKDNYCNTLRVWKGNAGVNATPLILSEGFDAYNTKPEQYYRSAGNDLINCLLTKGFDVYIINYKYNSQSIRNNATVFSSAIRYVSSINGSKPLVASGMSMGGIINRYASAKAEGNGTTLPISKFLSIDAPQQGANISETLQNWRKGITAGDAYAETASNNDAAKELLNYNAYDPSGSIHNTFYNELNSLNGDGYPHLVPTIGVSFSNASPNPTASGSKFLNVDVSGMISNSFDETFYLSVADVEAGSYLPKLNIDPTPVTYNNSPPAAVNMQNVVGISLKDLASSLISLFRPFSDPSVTIYQYSVPTFISHTSSLDIIGGISKFNIVIQPAVTTFHDEIPADIIQPLINAVINQDLYLQDKTITDARNYIASNKIVAGNNVTSSIPNGNFILASGSNVSMKAGNQIVLADGFVANSGSTFIAQIGPIQCDGVESQQYRSGMQNQESIVSAEAYNEQSKLKDEVIYRKAEKEIAKEESLKIYPNPSDNYFTIQTTETPRQIILYNSQGIQLIDYSKIESNLTKIDLSGEASGIYFLKIRKADGEYVIKKLIKQ